MKFQSRCYSNLSIASLRTYPKKVLSVKWCKDIMYPNVQNSENLKTILCFLKGDWLNICWYIYTKEYSCNNSNHVRIHFKCQYYMISLKQKPSWRICFHLLWVDIGCRNLFIKLPLVHWFYLGLRLFLFLIWLFLYFKIRM